MAEVRYFSYSRASKDSSCNRARYLGSEWGGTGLSPIFGGWDAEYGNIIHKWINILAIEGKINYSVARTDIETRAKEFGIALFLAQDWGAMGEGHLRGFVKCVWPHWIADYEILEAEKMRSWNIGTDNLYDGNIYRFRYRQDILFRNKHDGTIVYVDWKTTSDDSPRWIASWAKSAQLHSSAFALRECGITIDYMVIQGIYKGWKDKKTGGPGSIFAKGWVNREYSMSPQYSYKYERSKGWEPFSPASEFEDGLGEWVANMPEPILTAQFPRTAPIPPRFDIGAKWFAQQLYREVEVAEAVQKLHLVKSTEEMTQILDEHFQQDFDKCQPARGFDCEFAPICWIPSVNEDPLGSGQFKRREQVFEDGTEST